MKKRLGRGNQISSATQTWEEDQTTTSENYHQQMELVGHTPRKASTNITKKASQRNMVKEYLTSSPYVGPEENRSEAKTITHKDRE